MGLLCNIPQGEQMDAEFIERVYFLFIKFTSYGSKFLPLLAILVSKLLNQCYIVAEGLMIYVQSVLPAIKKCPTGLIGFGLPSPRPPCEQGEAGGSPGKPKK